MLKQQVRAALANVADAIKAAQKAPGGAQPQAALQTAGTGTAASTAEAGDSGPALCFF